MKSVSPILVATADSFGNSLSMIKVTFCFKFVTLFFCSLQINWFSSICMHLYFQQSFNDRDKGCVCIGNFGLHLAISKDNITSAVNAAINIEAALFALNIRVSLGASSGSAYCGLIGTNFRQEYTGA